MHGSTNDNRMKFLTPVRKSEKPLVCFFSALPCQPFSSIPPLANLGSYIDLCSPPFGVNMGTKRTTLYRMHTNPCGRCSSNPSHTNHPTIYKNGRAGVRELLLYQAVGNPSVFHFQKMITDETEGGRAAEKGAEHPHQKRSHDSASTYSIPREEGRRASWMQ